jgi:hypothetical protein
MIVHVSDAIKSHSTIMFWKELEFI